MRFAVMSLCGQHTFQVLTKRPDRMAAFFANEENNLSACQAEHTVMDADPRTPTGKSRIRNTSAINGTRKGLGDGNYWPLPNVWLGTSCGHQAAADEMIPHLLKCPAKVRFLSCEPLHGFIDLATAIGCGDRHEFDSAEFRRLHWVIVGGESGTKARPCDVAWIRSIVGQCKAVGVPCFVKQLGAYAFSWEDHEACRCAHCGKHGGSDIFDVLGAKSGNVFCNTCNREIESERWNTLDRKGGNMAEWPEDLRVRELPS
jgi:hypothetical protein